MIVLNVINNGLGQRLGTKACSTSMSEMNILYMGQHDQPSDLLAGAPFSSNTNLIVRPFHAVQVKTEFFFQNAKRICGMPLRESKWVGLSMGVFFLNSKALLWPYSLLEKGCYQCVMQSLSKFCWSKHICSSWEPHHDMANLTSP